MILAYTLSMPRNNAWNGKWSGEGQLYVRVRSYRKGQVAQKILDNQPYPYNFGDGWVARIDVREVTSAEARKLRKKSAGFCGYDWMIDTIVLYGKPLANDEIPEAVKA